MKFRYLLVTGTLAFVPFVHGWGGRGHHAICNAAVYLTAEKDLSRFLQFKPHVMGHLCNIPDTYWRSLPGPMIKYGTPTHYLDPEVLGLKVSEIPLSYTDIVSKYSGAPNLYNKENKIVSVPLEFGSNWWRADQFFRLSIGLKEEWQKITPPTQPREEFNDKHPFNVMTFQFTTYLGLAGHFIGDNAQPFHNTSDYDGYDKGHGGIHAFYEENMVASFSYDLEALVVSEGRKIQKELKNKKIPTDILFLKQKTLLARMRGLSEVSVGEIQTIITHDKVLTPSKVAEEKGMKIRTPAERKAIDKVPAVFHQLIVRQMARSAVLLAMTWDDAFVAVDRPAIKAAKSYKFPLTPDYVAPDYAPSEEGKDSK